MGNCGRALYGYQYDKDKKMFVVKPNEALVVKHIFMYFACGYTLNQTAQIINALGARTREGAKFTSDWVRRHLINNSYLGNNRYEQIITKTVDNAIKNHCGQDMEHIRKRKIDTEIYVSRKIKEDKYMRVMVMEGDMRDLITTCRGEAKVRKKKKYKYYRKSNEYGSNYYL